MDDARSECDLMQAHLAALAAGEGGGETGEALRSHLEGCARCRDEARSLAPLASRLRAELAEAPVPEEDEVDWERFRREVLASASGRGEPGRARPPVRAALAAAALLLAASLPLLLLERPAGPGIGESAPAGPTASGEGMGVAGTEAEPFLRGVEDARTRRELAAYLRGGRGLIVGLAGAPVFCRRDRRDVALERDLAVALLRRKQALDPDLEHPAFGRAREVSHDLERMLRVVAYLGDCPEPEEVRALLQAASERDLLLRLDAALQSLGERGGRRA
jgi:hypothetical protein